MTSDHDSPQDPLERAFLELCRLSVGVRARRFRELQRQLSEEDQDLLAKMLWFHDRETVAGDTTHHPTEIGWFQVKEVLGRGGMGIVYRVWDEKLQIDAALKVPSTLLTQIRGWIDRLHDEARKLAKLTSKHVARVFTYGESDGIHWVEMEFIHGPTLTEYVRKRGQLGESETLRFLTHIAEGLEAAHSHKIVHRDLKPDNVIIRDSREAVIIDFGIAKMVRESPDDRSAGPTQALRTLAAGTPEYACPEQLRHERVDERADVWGLGAVAYFCMSGRPPFPDRADGTDCLEPNLDLVPTEVGSCFVQWVKYCLAHDPAKRPASVGEAMKELLPEFPAKPAGSLMRKHLLFPTAVITIAIFLLAAVSVYAWVRGGIEREGTAPSPPLITDDPHDELYIVETVNDFAIRGLAEDGTMLWHHVFDAPVAFNLGTAPAGGKAPFCVFRTSDGMRCAIATLPVASNRAELHLLDGATGSALWSLNPEAPRSIRNPGATQKFAWVRSASMAPESDPVILAEVRQSTDTSCIEFISIEGRRVGHYMGPNNLVFAWQEDIDQDGSEEIYLYGESAGVELEPRPTSTGNSGIVIVLAPTLGAGQGYPYSQGSRIDWPDEPSFRELRLLLIPPPIGFSGRVTHLEKDLDAIDIHLHADGIIRVDRLLRELTVLGPHAEKLSGRTIWIDNTAEGDAVGSVEGD